MSGVAVKKKRPGATAKASPERTHSSRLSLSASSTKSVERVAEGYMDAQFRMRSVTTEATLRRMGTYKRRKDEEGTFVAKVIVGSLKVGGLLDADGKRMWAPAKDLLHTSPALVQRALWGADPSMKMLPQLAGLLDSLAATAPPPGFPPTHVIRVLHSWLVEYRRYNVHILEGSDTRATQDWVERLNTMSTEATSRLGSQASAVRANTIGPPGAVANVASAVQAQPQGGGQRQVRSMQIVGHTKKTTASKKRSATKTSARSSAAVVTSSMAAGDAAVDMLVGFRSGIENPISHVSTNQGEYAAYVRQEVQQREHADADASIASAPRGIAEVPSSSEAFTTALPEAPPSFGHRVASFDEREKDMYALQDLSLGTNAFAEMSAAALGSERSVAAMDFPQAQVERAPALEEPQHRYTPERGEEVDGRSTRPSVSQPRGRSSSPPAIPQVAPPASTVVYIEDTTAASVAVANSPPPHPQPPATADSGLQRQIDACRSEKAREEARVRALEDRLLRESQCSPSPGAEIGAPAPAAHTSAHTTATSLLPDTSGMSGIAGFPRAASTSASPSAASPQPRRGQHTQIASTAQQQQVPDASPAARTLTQHAHTYPLVDGGPGPAAVFDTSAVGHVQVPLGGGGGSPHASLASPYPHARSTTPHRLASMSSPPEMPRAQGVAPGGDGLASVATPRGAAPPSMTSAATREQELELLKESGELAQMQERRRQLEAAAAAAPTPATSTATAPPTRVSDVVNSPVAADTVHHPPAAAAAAVNPPPPHPDRSLDEAVRWLRERNRRLEGEGSAERRELVRAWDAAHKDGGDTPAPALVDAHSPSEAERVVAARVREAAKVQELEAKYRAMRDAYSAIRRSISPPRRPPSHTAGAAAAEEPLTTPQHMQAQAQVLPLPQHAQQYVPPPQQLPHPPSAAPFPPPAVEHQVQPQPQHARVGGASASPVHARSSSAVASSPYDDLNPPEPSLRVPVLSPAHGRKWSAPGASAAAAASPARSQQPWTPAPHASTASAVTPTRHTHTPGPGARPQHTDPAGPSGGGAFGPAERIEEPGRRAPSESSAPRHRLPSATADSSASALPGVGVIASQPPRRSDTAASTRSVSSSSRLQAPVLHASQVSAPAPPTPSVHSHASLPRGDSAAGELSAPPSVGGAGIYSHASSVSVPTQQPVHTALTTRGLPRTSPKPPSEVDEVRGAPAGAGVFPAIPEAAPSESGMSMDTSVCNAADVQVQALCALAWQQNQCITMCANFLGIPPPGIPDPAMQRTIEDAMATAEGFGARSDTLSSPPEEAALKQALQTQQQVLLSLARLCERAGMGSSDDPVLRAILSGPGVSV